MTPILTALAYVFLTLLALGLFGLAAGVLWAAFLPLGMIFKRFDDWLAGRRAVQRRLGL